MMRALLVFGLVLTGFSMAQAQEWGADESPNLTTRTWMKPFAVSHTVRATGSIPQALAKCDAVMGENGNCVVEIRQPLLNLPLQITRSHTKLLGIDGVVLQSAGDGPFIEISSATHHVIIEGITFQGHQSDNVGGILIDSESSYQIAILNNTFRDFDGLSYAYGVAAYGRGAEDASGIHNLIIEGNEFSAMRTGFGGSITVNGNVAQWSISDNYVHEVNNTAIAATGGEGTAAKQSVGGRIIPGEFDAARWGYIGNNRIENLSTVTNPAFGDQRAWVAAIYVDGGHHISVLDNTVIQAPWAFEIGAENCTTASHILLRGNTASGSYFGDVLLGAYAAGGYRELSGIDCDTMVDGDKGHGYVENVTVQGNRFISTAVEEAAISPQLRVTHTIISEPSAMAVNDTGNGTASGDGNAIRTRLAQLNVKGDIYPLPERPSTADPVALSVTIGCSLGATANAVAIDYLNREVKVAIDFGEHGFLCTPEITTEVPIGYLRDAGEYQFLIYEGSPDFDPQFYLGTFDLTVLTGNELAAIETPAEGSIQSGVGVIRGWACDAKDMSISIDDGPLIPVAYGSSREDTRKKCGDASNGYGMVMAWGLLSLGTHTLKTFQDNREIGHVTFTVAGIGGSGFTKGLSGIYDLEGFPTPGDRVTVRWSEPDQNFIIIDKHES